MKKINWKRLIIIILITFIIGSFFSFFTMNNMEAFKELEKPLNVPAILFPIVWSILYLLMSISCYIILESNDEHKNNGLIIYGIQLIINSLWSLIFFGLEAYFFSFLWILLLMIFVIFMIVTFYKINKISGLLQIPYLIWVIFAGYLNLGIYLLNK